jgi:mannose-6-phosphate isomerase-like protein (cupin superfamily)
MKALRCHLFEVHLKATSYNRRELIMPAFEIEEIIAQQQQVEQLYLEFLRVPTLSVGLYALPARGTDPQSPHAEDEVYYIISGQGLIRVAGKDRPVTAGSIVFVGAEVEHHFHTISEDLKILVFFAPAEGSLSDDPA